MISPQLKSELYEVDLDYTETVARFMDREDMFLKYFKKFFPAAEDTLKLLDDAITNGDNAEVERTAHALKGLAGNVGLNGVFYPAKKIVDDVRSNKTDEFRADFTKLSAAFHKAKQLAEKL